MGAIARAAANNITTSGVFTSGAITNSSVTGITVLANASDGITLISSQTASNSASLSFTTGIDSTYKAYKFVLVNISQTTGEVIGLFNFSTDGGSNYNVTKTSTYFRAYHEEADGIAELIYETGADLAQGTGDQRLTAYDNIGSASDKSLCSTIYLFNPSSTTYVKHFLATTQYITAGDASMNTYVGGYCNTTSAVNAFIFRLNSGNIASGKIYMYGIK